MSLEANKGQFIKLLDKERLLKAELKLVKEELAPFLKLLKAACLETNLKETTYGPYQVTYTKPREYFYLKTPVKKIAELYPELVGTKTGYERISFTPIKPAWMDMK